jgi:hypothetical protein
MTKMAFSFKKKWQAFLNRLAKENNQTFDGGKPTCCCGGNKKVTPKEASQQKSA